MQVILHWSIITVLMAVCASILLHGEYTRRAKSFPDVLGKAHKRRGRIQSPEGLAMVCKLTYLGRQSVIVLHRISKDRKEI